MNELIDQQSVSRAYAPGVSYYIVVVIVKSPCTFDLKNKKSTDWIILAKEADRYNKHFFGYIHFNGRSIEFIRILTYY